MQVKLWKKRAAMQELSKDTSSIAHLSRLCHSHFFRALSDPNEDSIEIQPFVIFFLKFYFPMCILENQV